MTVTTFSGQGEIINYFQEGFGISVATNKAIYSPDEPIIITLTVFNYTEDSLTFVFTSSKRYDFIIKKDEKDIWRWSEGRFFAQVMGEEKIEPGETLIYKEIYNPEDKIPAGSYSVTGIITCRENPRQATIYIKVK